MTADVARNKTSFYLPLGLFPRGTKVVGGRDTTSRCGEERTKRVVVVIAAVTDDDALGKGVDCLVPSKSCD